MLIKNLIDEEYFRKTAELYCEIWKESPWYEDFWRVEGVVEDIRTQSKKKNAISLIALDDQENIIGFIWGYQVSTKRLAEISGHTTSFWKEIIGTNAIFYVDDFGVKSEWRGNGIGQSLAAELIKRIPRSEIKAVTLRTDVDAGPARTVYAKIGFEESSVRDQKHKNRSYWLMKLS